MNIEERVINIIETVLGQSIVIQGNTDVSLMSLGFDSLKFIQLIIGLEDEFDIEIPDEFLLLQEMDDMDKLINIISPLISDEKNGLCG